MYTQEMLIGIGIACVLGGIILGLVAGRFLLRSKHAATLERELSEAQEALKEYKNEVFQQFGDTARKFEKLNESYADLHQQLATSASVLCADMPDVPLIASSIVPALQANEESTDATPQEDSTSGEAEQSTTPEAAIETPEAVEAAESDEVIEPASDAVTDKPTAP